MELLCFRLESPTRSLSMNAPKGVCLKALAGNTDVASNMDVILQSAIGMVSLLFANLWPVFVYLFVCFTSIY